MMRLLCLVVLLLTCVQSLSASPPKVSPKVEAQVFQLKNIEVTLEDKKELGYQIVGDDNSVYLEELPKKELTRRFVFQAAKAGTYTIVFWTVGEATGKVCTIVVSGDAAAKSDGTVIDPVLVKRLQDALAKDIAMFGAAEKDNAKKLAAVYIKVAGQIETEKILTVADLYKKLADETRSAQIPTRDASLQNVRVVLSVEPNDKYDGSADMSGAVKTFYLALFKRIGSNLQEATNK